MSLKNKFKGWLGEKITGALNWAFLDGKVYRQLNDVTLELPDGSTTQIDHLVISIYGIVIIETKNMSGWIYGSEKDATWTQVFKGGKKYKFKNPLRQNYRHQCAIVEFLSHRLPEYNFSKSDIETRIFSNVFFGPNAEIKSMEKLPDSVSGTIYFIKSKTEVVFDDGQVDSIYNALKEGKLPSGIIAGRATRKKHLASLEERKNRSTGDPCPNCGMKLVTRTRKKDGLEFIGCSGYPKCRFVKQN